MSQYRRSGRNNRSTLEFRDILCAITGVILRVIIDPHWNLELLPVFAPDTEAFRNNRSTLEFRVRALNFFTQGITVIIDPHWNLETCNTPYTQEGDVVIIDPHWNLETVSDHRRLYRIDRNNRSTLEFRGICRVQYL